MVKRAEVEDVHAAIWWPIKGKVGQLCKARVAIANYGQNPRPHIRRRGPDKFPTITTSGAATIGAVHCTAATSSCHPRVSMLQRICRMIPVHGRDSWFAARMRQTCGLGTAIFVKVTLPMRDCLQDQRRSVSRTKLCCLRFPCL